MTRHGGFTGRLRSWVPPGVAWLLTPVALCRAGVAGLLLLLWIGSVSAAPPPPFAARQGLDLATAAAHSWAADAVLIYVENDEPLDGSGSAARWGYLFHSPSLGLSRAYSIRNDKILVAENLEMKFEAPAVPGNWIDSGAAVAAAERDAEKFRTKYGAELRTMLLMRGAFQDDDPDRTTWTLVYAAAGQPALFVMVDAASGEVRRTWRG
jgi:hypothetical protein